MRDSDTVMGKESIHDIIDRTGGYPVICSHRGGGYEFAPENTMLGFKKSVHYGVRLLELDITYTKDLRLVIVHWPFIDATTDGRGFVSNYTLAELKRFDAAYHYPRFKGKGIMIPTLDEFLTEFAPKKDLLFMFDFKDVVSLTLTKAFIEKHYGRSLDGRYLLGSVLSEPNKILHVYHDSRLVPICTDITETFKITILYFLGLLDHYTFRHTLYGFILLPVTRPFFTKGLVNELHRRHCMVLVCGSELNKRETIEECISYGAEFIMLDRPDVYYAGKRRGSSLLKPKTHFITQKYGLS